MTFRDSLAGSQIIDGNILTAADINDTFYPLFIGSQSFLFDDFYYPSGTSFGPWVTDGNGSVLPMSGLNTGMLITVGVATSAEAAIGINEIIFQKGSVDIIVDARIRFSGLQVGSENRVVPIMLNDTFDQDSTSNAIFIRSHQDTGSMQLVTSSGGTNTPTDFTTNPSNYTFARYRLQVGSGNEVKAYVDGVLQATNTSNIPGVPLKLLLNGIDNSANFSVTTISEIDWVRITVPRS